VFEELGDGQMRDARRHVAQCLDCQQKVADFRQVRHRLEALPDVDLPRRMVFMPDIPETTAPSTRRRRWLPLAWGVPAGVLAALVLAVVLVGGAEVDWQDGGVRIALGDVSDPAPPVATPDPVPVEIDYEAIVARVMAEQASMIEAGLDSRVAELDSLNLREFDRLRGQMAVLYELQEANNRTTLAQAGSIQRLAFQARGTE